MQILFLDCKPIGIGARLLTSVGRKVRGSTPLQSANLHNTCYSKSLLALLLFLRKNTWYIMQMTNEKKIDTVAVQPDNKAVEKTEIALLRQEIDSLRTKLDSLTAEKALRPTGDYCVLGGKTFKVVGTVGAKFATDEARKGNLDLDAELVILKRD